MKKMVLKESVKKYTKRVQRYEVNCCNISTIFYGQCSYSLQARLHGRVNWESAFEENDLLNLLTST